MNKNQQPKIGTRTSRRVGTKSVIRRRVQLATRAAVRQARRGRV